MIWKTLGLINPIVVRKVKDKYEIISGHRRFQAIRLLGYKQIEADIKELTDDEATILMVDSNLQREKILPSEKAFAYKMKLDALKHQGKKINLTSSHNETKSRSDDQIAEEFKSSRNQIQRYIRLTHLIPELLKLVDDTVLYGRHQILTMGVTPAVELSYLSLDEQKLVYAEIEYEEVTPSFAQALRIKKLSQQGKLNVDNLEKILDEQKGNQRDQISFNKEKIIKVLPPGLINRDKRYIESYIIKAIENYKEQERESGNLNDLEL